MTTGPRPGSSFLTYPAPGDWAKSAGCRGLDPEFDPRLPGETPEQLQARISAALAVCRNRCPVRSSCEAWIMAAPRRYRQGVIGGTWWPTIHPGAAPKAA